MCANELLNCLMAANCLFDSEKRYSLFVVWINASFKMWTIIEIFLKPLSFVVICGLYYKTSHIRNVRKIDILGTKLLSLLWSASSLTNTLTYFLICPFCIHYKSVLLNNAGAMFTTLHFLHQSQIGPINYSATLN